MISLYNRSHRYLLDKLFEKFLFIVALISGLMVISIVLILLSHATTILNSPYVFTVFSDSWLPSDSSFGLYPFIAGTIWVTCIAMMLSAPSCILCAIFLAEYAPKKLRSTIKPLIDVLASIPSVVYGLWAILVIVPLVRDYVAPTVSSALGWIPIFSLNVNVGYSVLTSGFVLAIMVSPIIISVAEEVIRAVPMEIREASLALGATKWQTVKYVVFRKAFLGIVAAVILGFCRAFGETMAVLMVSGNVPKAPSSLFDPCCPLTALIASSLGEMMSSRTYVSALSIAALLLLLVILIFNILARLIVLKFSRG
ncbi:MAG: phosphate ABC transporter permease subunit PstC [Candidatus Methanomethylicota archaeon]|uniref:Phosphate transport system permease protein n=1 Tax=Thermoproteota archaeon TaxID=2056631 RepID=A0A497F021_9CREN|nr:MAG: phosphate ABC transporter permease subunit PstC [Candidatus Verstraetearchaeota archaeon]